MSKKEVLTWEPCVFIAFEWDRCDINGNGIYTAYFLAYGTFFHRFSVWGCSEERNILERLKPLTQCKLRLQWKRGKKWLLGVEPLQN